MRHESEFPQHPLNNLNKEGVFLRVKPFGGRGRKKDREFEANVQLANWKIKANQDSLQAILGESERVGPQGLQDEAEEATPVPFRRGGGRGAAGMAQNQKPLFAEGSGTPESDAAAAQYNLGLIEDLPQDGVD